MEWHVERVYAVAIVECNKNVTIRAVHKDALQRTINYYYKDKDN